MKKFKPQSPNPSVRKPSDAAPAVIGQLNELVDGKTDVENIKTTAFDIYPFMFTPTLTKLQDTITITNDNPNLVFHKYKLSGLISIAETNNYFNQYLGTIETVTSADCNVFYLSKTNITVTAFDGNYQIVSPFSLGAIMEDPNNESYVPLSQATIEIDANLSENYNEFYNYYNIILHGVAETATFLRGDINFEIEFLYASYCDQSPDVTYFFD
jgi:hypothetical protein